MIPKITIRTIFAWTMIASVLSAILAFAYRDHAWAMALVIAFGMALASKILGGIIYWVYWLVGAAQRSRITTPKTIGTE